MSASKTELGSYRLLVFSTALATLMFELVASRLADYHLGESNAYLAIPITFLGLALGSLHVHFDPRLVERWDAKRMLIGLAAVSFVALMVVFVVFTRLMPLTSELDILANQTYLLEKTLAFVAISIPPFYVFGRILATLYQLRRDDIGAIYSADFWGAATACALTPILFHFTGLPAVVLVLLVVTFAPVVLFAPMTGKQRAIVGGSLVGLTVVGQQSISWMDDHADYSSYREAHETREIAHAWNEHSRVAVTERPTLGWDSNRFKIIHDNDRSNVMVRRWRGPRDAPVTPKTLDAVEVPFIMGREVGSALVMFAGCGYEMTRFWDYMGGRGEITGVELNGLVRELAVSTPQLDYYRLAEFYAQPNVHHTIDEGRHFLARDTNQYDTIIVGSNAATGVLLTGHSRKFIDTVEAFELYLDRLAPGGLIIFDRQPIERRLRALRAAMENRGHTDFANKVVIVTSGVGNDDLILSPSGFTSGELWALKKAAKESKLRIRYARGAGIASERYRDAVELPLDPDEKLMTDDRPFLFGLDFENYQVLPGPHLSSFQDYQSWLKLSTLLILSVLAFVFIAVAASRKRSRLPPAVLIYLLITGFAFMVVEVVFMAKLELFLQKPLLTMATVLSVFLATSGIGSRLFPRVRKYVDPVWFPLLVALLVLGSTELLQLLTGELLALPTPAKLLLTVLIVAPVGISLGLFYPYAVSALVDNGHEQGVAISYGISTLASVVGSTYAMTFMIALGFNALLHQAAIAYVVLAAFVLIYRYALRGNCLTLRS